MLIGLIALWYLTKNLRGIIDTVQRFKDGISEEEQSYIFDRYQKTTRKGKQNSGAGLGLAIAKKILELHDATIKVQSKLNEGTAFMFQLPAYAF